MHIIYRGLALSQGRRPLPETQVLSDAFATNLGGRILKWPKGFKNRPVVLGISTHKSAKGILTHISPKIGTFWLIEKFRSLRGDFNQTNESGEDFENPRVHHAVPEHLSEA